MARPLNPGTNLFATVPAGQVWRIYYYAASLRVAVRVLTGPSSNGLYFLIVDHLNQRGLTSKLSTGILAEMPHIRTFIAIPLPQPVQERLDHISKSLKSQFPLQGARWSPANKIHITLHFLGEIAGEGIPALSTALADCASGHPPMQITLAGMGVFPNRRQPRVLWAGILPSAQLAGLHKAMGDALERLRYPVEERPFSPHLTLARLPQPIAPAQAQLVQALLEKNKDIQIGAFEAGEVHLVRSDLLPSGASYSSLGVYPLRG